MSLQVWLPLTKDLRQQGLSNISVTNNGATYSSTDGKLGGCYSFDGVDDAITIGNLSTLVTDTFSFSCWFYHNENWSSKNWETIFGGPSGFELESKNGSTNSPVIYAYSWGKGSFTYELSKWNHLVMTRTTSETKFYLNGELKLTGTAGSIPSGNYFIGSWSSTTGQNFRGKVNDVRIYDHCLSPMEVKELAKGLVLHYPLSDRYIEGTTNLASASVGGWDNSGASSRNVNDTSIPNKPTNGPTASSIVTAQGNCAFTCATTSASYPSKTLTFSLWYWQSGPQDTSVVYIRSNKTDGNVGNFEYNGSTSPNTWPKEKWIYLTKTITTASDATSFYICTYINPKDSKRAFNGWQIEEKDHATPWTAPGTTRTAASIFYDCSGFCNNGTRMGTFTLTSDTPKYNVSTVFPSGSNFITAGRGAMVTDSITVSLWCKYSTWGNPISCTEGGGWNFENGSNSIRFPVYVSGVGYKLAESNIAPSALINQWHMITGTFDKTNVKIYIDGELKGTTATGSTNGIAYPSSNAIFIGAESAGSATSPESSSFVGNISDVRIYATALSADDVKSLYQNSAYIDNSGNVYGAVH